MDTTVEAALIGGCVGLLGVAGTVSVAVAGFRANRHIATDATEDARKRAMWEKKCAAYEDILGLLHQRQAHRSSILGQARQGMASGQLNLPDFTGISAKFLADFHDPSTLQARNKLLAYASPEVRQRYTQMMVDDIALGVRLQSWAIYQFAEHAKSKALKKRTEIESHGNATDLNFQAFNSQMKVLDAIPAAASAWAQVEHQQRVVTGRDQDLIRQIREELGSDPQQVPDLEPWHGLLYVPAGRPPGLH
jgi:hypothetical protein